MQGWGEVFANTFLNLAKVLTPLLMSAFGLWLHKFLSRYHMTLFQAMIERHAQELVLAETNKAAVIIEGTGNKIQWSGVIAEAVKRLIATHSTLTETQAVNMVNAVMLKTTGIGPMDLKEVSDGRGDANPDGAVQGAVPGLKFTPGEATGGVSEVRGPIVNRSDPGLNIGGSGKGGGSGEVGAPDLHNQYR